MPTFEITGVNADGRPDRLKLQSQRKSDAVADAQRMGFTITNCVELSGDAPSAREQAERHLRAIEAIAASRIVRRPIWTICWGLILSSLVSFVIALLLLMAVGLIQLSTKGN